MSRCLAAVGLAALACGVAAANGRPPLTNGIVLQPGDDASLYVRSTFGLLISHDDGCSFRWVCEKAIGYGGEFDPKYAVTSDGTIFATTYTGLRVSRDGGCSWETATAQLPAGTPGRIADMWIDAIDIAPTGHLWVATAESAKPNDVFTSTDNGVTFTPMGLGSATAWWKSVKVAPSNAQRVYVTGYQVAPTTTAFLRRTDNGGQTWTDVPIPASVRLAATPFIHVVGVDRAAPDHLFMTSIGAAPPNGDRLYESTDGGTTFAEILVTTEAIRDVVLRPDGGVLVATLATGSFQRATGAGAFEPLGAPQPNAPDARPPHLGCLAQKADGTLVGCGANWQPDYMAVGRATDPLAFEKVFRFVELAGTLACPAGTTSAVECDPMWPALQQQFGATGPAASCGVQPDVTIPKPPVASTGCCDARGTAGPGAMLAACGVLMLLVRRRRMRPCCRS